MAAVADLYERQVKPLVHHYWQDGADADPVTISLDTPGVFLMVSVYRMRMARVNIYLPEELAQEAKAAGLNISRVAQEALRAELAARRTAEWLDGIAALPPTGVTHEQVLAALDEARREAWGDEEWGDRG